MSERRQGDEDEPTDEERREAERLRVQLESPPSADDPRAIAVAHRAANGLERLGEVAARALVRRAIDGAAPPSRARRGRRIVAIAGVAAALLLLGASVAELGTLARRDDALPARLTSRGAGRLMPGPFPPSQSAAQRLDLVAADRMVALRELRIRRLRRGAP